MSGLKELREAAKRLAGSDWKCTGCVSVGVTGSEPVDPSQVKSIAREWLSEHPADEEEPLTKEVLVRFGFRVHDGGWGRMALRDADEVGVHLCFNPDEKRCWVQETWYRKHDSGFFDTREIANVNLSWPETIRDFRRLAATLGIELTETTNGKDG